MRLHVLHQACEGDIFSLNMIEELGRHGYKLSPGTMYPMLHSLENRGHLKSSAFRSARERRRMYKATRSGRRAFSDVVNNPALKEQAVVIEEPEAGLRVLQRSYRPTFDLGAGAYACGSGALTNGSTLGGWNGLGPNYFNAAAGVTVNFQLLALPSIRVQEAQEMAIGRAVSARPSMV